MSKFAIVLCAALFASANSISWEEPLKAIQLNVDHMINSAILKVEDEYMTNQFETVTVGADLSDAAGKFGDKVWHDITRITQNITSEINNLIANGKNSCIDDCLKISDKLSDVTNAAITSMSACINDKLTSGLQYIDTINKESGDVITKLNNLKERAKNCGNDVNDAKSVAEAIFCSKAAATDATWATVKAAPKLTGAWTKLKFLVVTLPSYLSECDSTKPLVNFYEQSSTAVERFDKCIERNKDKTPIDTPDSDDDLESDEDTNLGGSPKPCLYRI